MDWVEKGNPLQVLYDFPGQVPEINRNWRCTLTGRRHCRKYCMIHIDRFGVLGFN